eukprot:412459_1
MVLLLNLVLFVLSDAYQIPDGYIQYEHGCAWAPADNYKPKEVIKTPLPYAHKMFDNPLPLNFSWTSAGPANSSLVTGNVRHQMVPNACGCCWAIASTGALSDRLKIETFKKTGSIPVDINLAPQYLLDLCFYSHYDCGSCNGGSANSAYSVIYQTSISDESCSPFIGREVSFWAELPPTEYICRTCGTDGSCSLIPPNPTMNFSVEEHGNLNYKNFYPNNTKTNVTMVDAMMQEIYTRGPIACSMYAHSHEFETYNGTYILVDNTKYKGTTHVLVLMGWGETSDGLKYWIGRNSFGTIWGNQGFFLAQRSVNIYNMETNCDWATVKFPPGFFAEKISMG